VFPTADPDKNPTCTSGNSLRTKRKENSFWFPSNTTIFYLFYNDNTFRSYWSSSGYLQKKKTQNKVKRSANNIFVIWEPTKLTKFVSNYTKLLSSLWYTSVVYGTVQMFDDETKLKHLTFLCTLCTVPKDVKRNTVVSSGMCMETSLPNFHN
jgi:hypothetical protein